MSRDWFAGLLVPLALCLAPLAATPATPGVDGATPASDAVSAARGYRASLDHLLPFREHAVTRARETAFARRQLLADGLASRREAEIAEQRLAEAEAALAATQAAIVQADRMVAEATAAAVLASLPPTKPGTITVTPLLTRFRGSREWSLAHVPSVERFFSERFHHPLPVSALGQTPAHDRLGFDHRNAMDVAVHPDSPEGQALMMAAGAGRVVPGVPQRHHRRGNWRPRAHRRAVAPTRRAGRLANGCLAIDWARFRGRTLRSTARRRYASAIALITMPIPVITIARSDRSG